MEKQYKNEQMFAVGGTEYTVFREKDWYKEKIIEMANQINNEKYLKMIYGFVNRLHKK